MKNIYLYGFMGTGKTTVAAILARKLGTGLVDTDALIEKKENRTISQIFAGSGEAYFRALERSTLDELASRDGLVVSCGGGIPLAEENRRILKGSRRAFWLTASPEEIFRRISDDRTRPLLAGDMTVDRIKAMTNARESCYEAAGGVKTATDGKTPESVAEEIISFLSSDR